MKKEKQNQILLIDKPRGISSFDVIRILRKKIGVRNPSTGLRIKIGHAGTLDPLASGLLILGIGEGTKKLKDFIGLDKTYEMEVLLGRQTDTGDMEGRVIDEASVGNVGIDKVKEILKSLEGEIELEISIYSALKVGGVPMYRLARQGKKVEPKKRKMKIYSLKFLNYRQEDGRHILKVKLECGSGTYARSVAEEIGRRLGYPATVYSLRRTKVGDFKIGDAEKIN